MYFLIISGIACMAIAMALLDQRNKKLKQENDRLRGEITARHKYAAKLEY
jgi:hypothetical protein